MNANTPAYPHEEQDSCGNPMDRKGKCGVLTGTKRTPEEICVECVEVKIDGITWAILCEFPQFVVCDASEVSR